MRIVATGPTVQVQDEARRAFGPLLERQSKAERIKQVLGLIRRYEAVVRLPSRVREHAQARDYEEVGGRKCWCCDRQTCGGVAGTWPEVRNAWTFDSLLPHSCLDAAVIPAIQRDPAGLHCLPQVVADYRKARALLADHTSELPQQAQQDSMWLKLLEEIDKVGTGRGARLCCVHLESSEP